MAARQVTLNESSDIMWETSYWNDSGQGEMEKLGKFNKKNSFKKSMKSWTEIYSAFR